MKRQAEKERNRKERLEKEKLEQEQKRLEMLEKQRLEDERKQREEEIRQKQYLDDRTQEILSKIKGEKSSVTRKVINVESQDCVMANKIDTEMYESTRQEAVEVFITTSTEITSQHPQTTNVSLQEQHMVSSDGNNLHQLHSTADCTTESSMRGPQENETQSSMSSIDSQQPNRDITNVAEQLELTTVNSKAIRHESLPTSISSQCELKDSVNHMTDVEQAPNMKETKQIEVSYEISDEIKNNSLQIVSNVSSTTWTQDNTIHDSSDLPSVAVDIESRQLQWMQNCVSHR